MLTPQFTLDIHRELVVDLFAGAAFLATVPVANWLIGNVGTVCMPGGPCLVPVLPGLMAPSGVLVIGVAMVLRDVLRERLGLRGVLGLLIVGAFLSLLLAPPHLAMAAVFAFAFAELVDTAVYEPLRPRYTVKASPRPSLTLSRGGLWLFGMQHWRRWHDEQSRPRKQAAAALPPYPWLGSRGNFRP